MYSIFDPECWEHGEEFDIWESVDKEQCEYERKNKDKLEITILKEPEI